MSNRARLQAVKLAALVRDHLGGSVPTTTDELGDGAALVVDDTVWVLVGDGPAGHGLGAALAVMRRAAASGVEIVADAGEGQLARRAAAFSVPIGVWRADGRRLVAATATALPVPSPAPADHHRFERMIADAGAEPVVEHGVVIGEVLGLEVCRVVDDPFTGTARLDIGVGAHDREAFQLLHGDRRVLVDVVDAVRRHRTDPSAAHPLARLARERLLRSALIAVPGTIGLADLRASMPPLPRENLKDPAPCVAEGLTADGERVVVVCSTGVDLDVVPYCTDARRSTGIDRCMLVVPTRDAIPLQHHLAAVASPPVDIVAVDVDAALAVLARP